MQALHELIDIDEPKCLYCQNDCNDMSSENLFITGNAFQNFVFKCAFCNEKFSFCKDYKNTNVCYFVFSCKDYDVVYDYNLGILIDTIENDLHDPIMLFSLTYQESVTYIDFFELNFSNKENLYQKLKTYIVFS